MNYSCGSAANGLVFTLHLYSDTPQVRFRLCVAGQQRLLDITLYFLPPIRM